MPITLIVWPVTLYCLNNCIIDLIHVYAHMQIIYATAKKMVEYSQYMHACTEPTIEQLGWTESATVSVMRRKKW